MGAAAGGALLTGATPALGAPRPEVSPLQRGEADGQPIAFRGTILDFYDDPGADLEPARQGPGAKVRFFADGILVVNGAGKVDFADAWNSDYAQAYAGRIVDYRGKVIIPGMIDTHVHYVQMDAIAGYGDQILQWLEKYIFPAESKFENLDHAQQVAGFFLDHLLSAGTTSALVWSTTPKESADGFFREAQARHLRMITGKVVQDGSGWGGNQNDASVDAARQGTEELIQQWHGVDRLLYAVTPRFAPTCSAPMLKMCGELLDKYQLLGFPVWLQTHLSENLEEECVVRKDFHTNSYAEAYQRNGDLFRPRSLFAHCVEIGARDREMIAQGGASIGHCPTSNFFLGSGTHNLFEARQAGIRVGLGTDCGAGTTYSLLATMGASYKSQVLRNREYLSPDRRPQLTTEAPIEPVWGATCPENPLPAKEFHKLTAWRAFYLATRGGAEALYLSQPEKFTDLQGNQRERGGIGWFGAGNEADFVVLDLAATPIIKRRIEAVEPYTTPRPGSGEQPKKRSEMEMWHEKLFALMTLGDDRATYATYIMGKLSFLKGHGVLRPSWPKLPA